MDFCSYPSEILYFATRHAATLEKLTVRNGLLTDLYGNISAPELPGMDRISCPRVHTLVLRHLGVLEDAAAIHDTFPALRHLELSMATDEEVDAEEIRQDSAPEDDGEYPRDVLDRLCGAVNALYGLCGAYGANILEVYRIFSDEEQLKRLRTVISDVQPTHLVLHAGENYPGAGAHFSAMDLLFLLPEEDTKLTHLVLNMEISALKGVYSTLSAFMFALIELLRAHPVQFLILRFLKHAVYDQELEEAKILQNDALAGNLRDEDKPNEIVEGLSSTTMPLIIRRLLEADTALAHLVVDIEGKGCEYWEIHDSHGDLQMWMLDDTAGRALVQAEGLGLRDGRVEAFCDPILRNY
ncbi:hypothetical protein C2E23DRAFT_345539 [Lenzites betulinus]|nr:hypothetical protein C2E23DRAFT_345539 [Lenzites betulinus]